jgi:hypothetical protein
VLSDGVTVTHGDQSVIYILGVLWLVIDGGHLVDAPADFVRVMSTS